MSAIAAVPALPEFMALALLAVLGLQLLLTLRFRAVVHQRLRQRPPLQPPLPAAEVVLCLRGADPSLPAALAALAAQSYPGPWRLLLLVDSRQDPAWSVAEAQIRSLEASGAARWCAARLIPLADPPRWGSLKSAALRQACAALDPATDLLALVDGDAVVAPGWLEALAAGCAQPGVGAVSGNRWYVPAAGTGPGRVRAIWNAGALVLMTLFTIPWGGSLALRRAVINGTAWHERLATSLCEDTPLPQALAGSGWRYEFRPELLALDQDDGIALATLTRWISRQLLTARLHHRAWPLVALHGLGSAGLLLLALLLVLRAGWQGQLADGALLLAALLGYEIGCVGLLLLIAASARRALAPLGQVLPPARLADAWQLLRWLPVAQAVYGWATLRAAWARRVEWRGVRYRVRGDAVERL